MARIARLTLPGYPHHVIQRGNNRQAIFNDPIDFQTYLLQLRDLSRSYWVAIHAYVLMPNHVHLLATPAEDGGLSRLMQALGRRYVGWFNHRHQRSGTLWEGRFRSSLLQTDRYLLACARYIELNPVRAGLVEQPEVYQWSSSAYHFGLRPDPLITEHPLIWSLGNTPFERQHAYRRLFSEVINEKDLSVIRQNIQSGGVVGEPEFLAELSQQRPNNSIVRKPRGRPKKGNV